MTTAILVPGNMCDARLWRGGDAVLLDTLAAHGLDALDADTTCDDNIANMAARALRLTGGPLLPIGFSMGAIVALEMARQAPDRVAGLVLVGLNATADLPERAAHRPAQQAEVEAGGLERVLVEELKPSYLARARHNDLPLLDLLRDMGMALGSGVFVAQSEALRLRDDLRPVLPELHVPVLLMCGAEDELVPPGWHRNWAVTIRDARLQIVAGAGHMLPLEDPQAMAATISDWLVQRRVTCLTVS